MGKVELKAIAKAESGERQRGYGSPNKHNMVDTILYRCRVVKLQIEDLSRLTKAELVRIVPAEGLKVIGGKKASIAHNIVLSRVSSRVGAMQHIVENVANAEVIEIAMTERFRPQEIEGAFDGNFVRFKSRGVEEDRLMVSVEQYLEKTKRHVAGCLRR